MIQKTEVKNARRILSARRKTRRKPGNKSTEQYIKHQSMERREVSSRSNPVIRGLASALVRTRISANQVSGFSALIALLVPAGLLCIRGWSGLVLAILGIQLRLLANVIDGLVAIEGGKASPAGALYNEFPDRISDSIILVSIGYAAHLPAAGWCAALIAALTAYVRAFGGALGHPQTFAGPMAKQHRMAVCTAGIVVWGVASHVVTMAEYAGLTLQVALWIMIVGSVWTCGRRTKIIGDQISRARVIVGISGATTESAE